MCHRVVVGVVVGSVPPGPSFDEEGTFMSHSIIGKAEDFANELKSMKLVRWNTIS